MKPQAPVAVDVMAALSQTLADWFWECDTQLRFTWHELPGRRMTPSLCQEVDPAWRNGERPPFGASHALAFDAATKSKQAFRNVELICHLADGSVRPLIVVGEPVVIQDGGKQWVAGFRGLARDLATRSRTEELIHIEHEVARVLAEADDPAQGLGEAIACIGKAEAWPCGEFWMIDQARTHLRFFAGWDQLDDDTRHLIVQARDVRFPKGLGLVGLVWESGEPIWSGELLTDPRLQRKELARAAHLRSAFVFPATADGEIVGVFSFWSQNQRAPDARLMEATKALGRQIGQFVLRRQGETILRESEARFRALTALSADGYWETDLRSCLSRVEGRCIALDAQCVGKTFQELGFEPEGGWVEVFQALQQRRPLRDVVLTRSVDGELQFISLSGEPMFDADLAFVGYRGVSRDISDRRRDEERIRYLAMHDALTGLPNRSMFARLLNREIEAARRFGRNFSVLFIDLDRFKNVNDTLGHDAGDYLLREIAKRFKACLRASDTLARLGGDEFVALLECAQGEAGTQVVATKLLEAALTPVVINGQECRVSASIGVANFPGDAEDESTLMRHADMAMYAAKEAGKNNIQLYDPRFRSQAHERMELEQALRRALDDGQLFLHFQPKVAVLSQQLSGVEALLRWVHPTLGNVSPARFIPIAEESGLILPIGKWVLHEACRQTKAWQAAGLPSVRMAVNLSQRQFDDPQLVRSLRDLLQSHQLDPQWLELEITESMVMQDTERAIALLRDIKRLGVRLAIDDFGTGYSSLAQLKRFPVDTLKVDRSFIREITSSSDDKAIAEAIITMGRSLGLSVVAEGVETAEQLAALRARDCDEMQGYLFARPMPAAHFEQMLRDRR